MVMRNYSLQIEDKDRDTIIFEADTGSLGQVMVTGISHDRVLANTWGVILEMADIEALQDFLSQIRREYHKSKGEDYYP
jgi:hypothetical protein